MSTADRRPWALALAGVLLVALALRLWGIGHGLPYAFNADENAHFVPRAIGFFGHSYNPQYFVNPPAYTYLLHAVFAVWFGGRAGVANAFATDPSEVFLVARVTAALLGVVAVWLLYLLGARLLDRRAGLLAAALLAVAFLPVFYSHLALNDVPTLAPLTLSLLGTAGVLRRGRPLDWLLAGGALGLACATKYTAGIALLPLLAAAAIRSREPRDRAGVVGGLALAAAAAAALFVAANPYAVLDWNRFVDGLNHQSTASDDAQGKLGLTSDSGFAYYLWTLTWGLGVVPALAAAGGALALLRENRRLALVLLPAPVVFILFMGSQERFFGRWLLPLFPILALLAAHGALRVVDAVARRRPRAGPALAAAATLALLAQGLLYSVHNDLVLSREDTRNVARAWLVARVPEGSKIVVEPIAPDQWAQDPGRPSRATSNGNRWIKFPTARSLINNDGSLRRGIGRPVNVEDYERTLRPALLDTYERAGFCWVVSGSTQSGRALAEPDEVPRAIAYYRELRRRGRVVLRVSPYDPGAGPVAFNFDFSFDYYPLAYRRPGPEVTVYRLTGGRCAKLSPSGRSRP